MTFRIALAVMGFAVCAQGVSVSPTDTVIAQIASGGSWKTTIQLVNLGTKQALFTIIFYDDTGAPAQFNIVGGGRATSVSGSLAVGGARIIEIEDTSNNTLQGWGLMQTTDSIGGQVILRQRVPGQPDFEGAVPIASQSDRHYFIPFDQSSGFITGYALANTSPATQQMLMTFRDETGAELRRATLNFPGLAHQVFALGQFPELSGKRGYTEVTVPFTGGQTAIIQSVAAMALRFNPTGPFTTVFPVVSQSDRTF
jgi:hypothetical protein